jgi:hypothetical protein
MLARPEDVTNEWLLAIRSAIASCSGNKGYGMVTLTVAVNGTTPIMHYPEMKKIHPKKLSGVKVTPEVAVALSAIMKNSSDTD